MVNKFKVDLETIKKRAIEHMAEGAVTESNTIDNKELINVLNLALATELVCIMRYKRHYFTAESIKASVVKEELLEHAKQEQEHADKICERICQLGGEPDLNPATLMDRSHSEYSETTDLEQIIKDNLVAERVAVEFYTQLIRWVENKDPVTRRMLEGILEQEEEHADEFAEFLKSYN